MRVRRWLEAVAFGVTSLLLCYYCYCEALKFGVLDDDGGAYECELGELPLLLLLLMMMMMRIGDRERWRDPGGLLLAMTRVGCCWPCEVLYLLLHAMSYLLLHVM